MINQGFFLQPKSGGAQWPRTSKMQPVCAAPNLIRIKYPFEIILVGKNLLKNVLGLVGLVISFKIGQLFVQ